MNSVQGLCVLFNLKLESSISCHIENLNLFENSVKIYINKPQVINKWSAGSVILEDYKIYESIENENDKLIINKCLTNPLFEIENREFLAKNLKIFENINYFILYDRNLQLFILKPYFITKNIKKKCCACWHTHAFEFDKANKRINLYVDALSKNENASSSEEDNISWLSNILLKKISNWCLNIIPSDDLNSCLKLSTLTLYKNMLIDYYKLYQELKDKYSHELASMNWQEMTNTNPEKFIHEDISICAHMILTWQYFNIDKNSIKFVDLGCGNGLLVYLLNQEGFSGYGIDLRKRRIWDLYSINNKEFKLKLIEASIDPRIDKYVESNWLIGNHSDELSPWLPLIANRTNCNIYLIPCCFYDFNGKYSFGQIKKNESRYDNYVNYLKEIFYLNGFDVYRDKLRIPSTKNFCLIGIRNLRQDIDHEKLDLLTNKDSCSFKIRDFEEEKNKSSRNCTRNVENDIKDYIVKKILDCVLSKNDEEIIILKNDNKIWHVGGKVNINEIIKLFDANILIKLKQECGGIKTLIKNYNQLFEIVDKDCIKLRIEHVDNSKNKDKLKFLKTKKCLFEIYHPDGCLLDSNTCCFIH